jgi:hypothetical protein
LISSQPKADHAQSLLALVQGKPTNNDGVIEAPQEPHNSHDSEVEMDDNIPRAEEEEEQLLDNTGIIQEELGAGQDDAMPVDDDDWLPNGDLDMYDMYNDPLAGGSGHIDQPVAGPSQVKKVERKYE